MQLTKYKQINYVMIYALYGKAITAHQSPYIAC